MMDGMSRREAMAMAGASLVLASKPICPDEAAERCPENVAAQKYGASHGYDDHWGKDPKGGHEWPVNIHQYDPKYIAIAIIDFTKSWSADVHHASFPLGSSGAQTPEDYRRDLAIRLIGWTIENKRKLGALSGNQFNMKDHVPYKRKAGTYTEQHHINSFDEFKFKSQNEVFIFLRNSNILLNEDRLIRFTRYSFNAKEMDKNYSFFNAKLVNDHHLGDLARFGKLIRVENHVTNCDGSPIVEPTDYSMNILFGVRSLSGVRGQAYLPMIIDPETGNGAGHEP